MSMSSHVDALRERHRQLDDQINAEHQRPRPNDDMLHELKQRKLQLKDEIERLSS